MKKTMMALLVLVAIVGLSIVQAQTEENAPCDGCALIKGILQELRIANNNIPGEVVTGMHVLKDGQPGATGHWLDMPVGTCDVTLFSEAGGLNHAAGTYSYSMSAAQDATATAPGTQFCSSNGNWWTSCTRTLTFDNQFHFLHLSGPGDVIYLQVVYKCVLA